MPDLHRGLGPAREGGTIVGFLFARWPRVRVATAGLISTIFVASLLLGGASGVVAKDHESNRPGSVDVQLLAVNDFHGALDPSLTKPVALDNTTWYYRGGAEYLATFVNAAAA